VPGHLSNVVSLVVQELFKPVYLYGLSHLVSYVYVVVYDFLQLERMISLVKIYFIFVCMNVVVSLCRIRETVK
jgi:hypothetical protein